MPTTWYVKAVGGSNANSGLDAVNAFGTLEYAINAGGVGNTLLAAGDTIRVCADADHLITSFLVPGVTGNMLQPISVESADATGVVDGTKATLRPHSSSLTSLLATAAGLNDWRWSNLIFDGENPDGIRRASNLFNGTPTNTALRWRFTDCDFKRATLANARQRGQTFYTYCTSSEAGTIGFDSLSASDAVYLESCDSFDNGTDGALFGSNTSSYIYGCRFYRNGSHGGNASTGAFSYVGFIGNCLFYLNGGAGLRLAQTGASVCIAPMINNTFVGNLDVGILMDQAGVDTADEVQNLLHLLHNNHSYDNFNGHTNHEALLPWASISQNNITGDPLFTNAASGDFTPLIGSALIGAGINGHDIGPNKYQGSGGGGPAGFPLSRILN